MSFVSFRTDGLELLPTLVFTYPAMLGLITLLAVKIKIYSFNNSYLHVLMGFWGFGVLGF